MSEKDRNWEFILMVDKKLDTVVETVSKTREDIAGLKIKAGLWGAFGGVLIGMPMLIYALIKITTN